MAVARRDVVDREHRRDRRDPRRHPGARGRHRHIAGAPRRHRQGAGLVRVLLRPVGRGLPVGGDAALAASVRADRQHRRRAGVADHRRRGRHHRRRRARPAHLRAHLPGPARVRHRPRALRRRTGRRGRRRPSRDVPAGAGGDRRRVRGARAVDRPRGGDRRHTRPDPSRRQRHPPPAHRQRRRRRDAGRSWSRARTRSGCRTRRSSGSRPRSPLPDHGGGGVELHIATQWLHEDRKQIAACLGLPEDKVRLVLGGVGGAFGAREDISPAGAHVPARAAPGRPVRMQYGRDESFLGHVHRHPATVWMRHHATADGEIVKIEARYVFDGGAYASTSSAVLLNAITHTQGPYRCPNAVVDGWAVRTNHLPCGAMRGFGVVQACFAHESQMDRLAAACGLDPVEVRLRNAMRTGDVLITGQVVESVAPVERCIRETAALPLPDEPIGGHDGDVMRLPGGAGRTADTGHVRRGIGWGVAIKNLMYSRGLRRLLHGALPPRRRSSRRSSSRPPRSARASSRSPQQIARTILGVDDVVLDAIDTAIGSAGSTSASRQTWMSGGAVDAACRAVRERLFEHVGPAHGIDPLRLAIEGTDVVDTSRAGSRAGRRRRGVGRDRDRRDGRVPPPPDRGPRRERPGQLPRRVRVRRPPRRRRRRSRARPGQGRPGRHRTGRRPRAQPAVGRSARSRAASPRASAWP